MPIFLDALSTAFQSLLRIGGARDTERNYTDTVMRVILKHVSYRPRDALSVMVFSVGSFHEPIARLQG